MKKWIAGAVLPLMIIALNGSLRVEVATPDKPIDINMNVKIEHEINVRIDRQVEDLLKNNSAIF